MLNSKDNCGTISCKRKRLQLAIFCSQVVEEVSQEKTSRPLRFEEMNKVKEKVIFFSGSHRRRTWWGNSPG